MILRLVVLVITLLAIEGCDRRVEPFVPGEKPQTPDLTKIFPEGAERAAQPVADMPPRSGRGAAPVAARTPPIEGTIELAPELVGSVPPNAVVFLMARNPGNGSLVAAKRINTSRFPLAFSIGSEDSMSAATPFQSPLLVTVRIDADGNATTRDVGDLLGSSAETHGPGDRGVVVRVSEVQEVEFAASLSPAGATGDPHAAAGVPPAIPTGAQSAAATGATSEAIEGTLQLAPELAGRVPPGATLFVIARTAPTGPPLAVVRLANPSFPMPFSIGPDDRMIQSMPFAGQIQISVRVDADGNVMTQNPGDLQGGSGIPKAPGDRGVTLLIDKVL
jgi:hypothetical protein